MTDKRDDDFDVSPIVERVNTIMLYWRLLREERAEKK